MTILDGEAGLYPKVLAFEAAMQYPETGRGAS